MSHTSRPTTIAQVASHAGVSPATVSRIMNGRFVGDEAVAQRVRESAAALAYRPNHAARSLALGRTGAVAFVVPDLANPAFQAVLSGLSKTAARDGYRVLVADSGEDIVDEPELVEEIRRRCDAIVLCAPRMPHDELLRLADSLRPLVLVNRPDANVAAPSLSIDYGAGIRDLTAHLHQLGHAKIAYLAGPPQSVSNALREAALDDFEHATPEVSVTRIACGVGIEDGLNAADAVVAADVTGVVAFNDLVAIGLMNGLAERGLSVPADISVAGFDDIPYARYSSPSLTTVSVPHTELGVEAWGRMRAVLERPQPTQSTTFTPQLEVRGSTSSPV